MGPMPRPSLLTDAELAAALAALPGWEHAGAEIVRTFECASFPDAIAFVVRIGFFAERADHHPDIDIRWRKVRRVHGVEAGLTCRSRSPSASSWSCSW